MNDDKPADNGSGREQIQKQAEPGTIQRAALEPALAAAIGVAESVEMFCHEVAELRIQPGVPRKVMPRAGFVAAYMFLALAGLPMAFGLGVLFTVKTSFVGEIAPAVEEPGPRLLVIPPVFVAPESEDGEGS